MQYVDEPKLLEDFIDYFKYKVCDLLDRNFQYAAYSNQTGSEKPVPQMSSIISMYLVKILREFADGNLKQSKETFVKTFNLSSESFVDTLSMLSDKKKKNNEKKENNKNHKTDKKEKFRKHKFIKYWKNDTYMS